MSENKLKNPLNEEVESVGEHNEQVGEVDEFEMNQAEKSETLEEHPANEPYNGPEAQPADRSTKTEN